MHNRSKKIHEKCWENLIRIFFLQTLFSYQEQHQVHVHCSNVYRAFFFMNFCWSKVLVQCTQVFIVFVHSVTVKLPNVYKPSCNIVQHKKCIVMVYYKVGLLVILQRSMALRCLGKVFGKYMLYVCTLYNDQLRKWSSRDMYDGNSTVEVYEALQCNPFY